MFKAFAQGMGAGLGFGVGLLVVSGITGWVAGKALRAGFSAWGQTARETIRLKYEDKGSEPGND